MALTSTLSATLSSVSTLFTLDFYSKIDRNADTKKLVRVGQVTSLIVLMIAIFWAPRITRFDSLVAYYQEVVSYLAPPIVGSFLLGVFWKRSNGIGAFTGLMSGLVLAAAMMVTKYVLGIDIGMHFLVLAPVIMIASMTVNLVVSLATAPPTPEKVKENTWTRQIWHVETKEMQGLPWYQNFRVLSLLLVVACFVMYFLYF
jgi:SSS family solute:Na+ symporter